MASKRDLLESMFKHDPSLAPTKAAKLVGVGKRYARRVKFELLEECKASVKRTEKPVEKIGILSDIHVPYQDKKAVNAAISSLKAEEIDRLVLLGDICDFYSVSYFKKDPRRMSFLEEIEAAKKFLVDLRKDFPNIPITYIEGNHEARLQSYLIDRAPELVGFDAFSVDGLLGLNALDIEYVQNVNRIVNGEEPFQIGKLVFLHGHEIKASWSSVNLPRLIFQKTKYNTIFGHFHKQQDYITKDIFGSMLGAWSVGCLCHTAETYMPVNEWSQGFAIVSVNKETGRFSVHNKLIFRGEVL